MKKLDWYIIKRFLVTFGVTMGMIMMIAVVFDLSEKAEQFLGNNASLADVFIGYYPNFILFYANTFSSLIIFLSVILFTSIMAKNTEIIPMLTGGMSFNRFLRPYMISATILVAFFLLMTHFIIPPSNRKRMEFEDKYDSQHHRLNGFVFEGEPGKKVIIDSYSSGDNIAKDLYISKRNFDKESDNFGYIDYILFAQKAINDTVTGKWTLQHYSIRKFDGFGEHVVAQGPKLDTTFEFKITQFTVPPERKAAMATPALIKQIEKERKIGSKNIPMYLLSLHERTSLPMATYVLTLIGVCIASEKKRGGIGMSLMIGILIVALYIFSQRMMAVSALQAGFNPLLAAWMPNIIFGIVSIFYYFKAQK